jgi:hypothetical protein
MSKSLSNVNINKPFTQDNARTGKGENTADQASRKDTSKRASAVRDSIINNNNSKNSTIYQELRETTNSKEIPDRISNDSPFLLIDRDF